MQVRFGSRSGRRAAGRKRWKGARRYAPEGVVPASRRRVRGREGLVERVCARMQPDVPPMKGLGRKMKGV
jgi:hypothetical protein